MQIAAEPSRKRTVAQPSTSSGIIILSGAEGCKLRPTNLNAIAALSLIVIMPF
jgi:hypothetical protein